jgi:hypothetical protein
VQKLTLNILGWTVHWIDCVDLKDFFYINWAVLLAKFGELILDVKRLTDLFRHRCTALRFARLTATARLTTSNIIKIKFYSVTLNLVPSLHH